MFPCVTGALQDVLVHRRILKHSMTTHWLYDAAARTGSDLSIISVINGIKQIKWVDFPDRPWGEAPPVCVCQEPANSHGRPRKWEMDEKDPRDIATASRLTLVCSWCQEKVVVRRKTEVPPQLQHIGGFFYTEV